MSQKADKRHQTNAESILISFLENDLPDELIRLHNSHFENLNEWFKSTRDELFRLKREDHLYQLKVDLLTRKLPELQKITEVYSTTKWHADFIDSIKHLAGKLPEKLVEEQGDFHLKSQESDSTFSKTVKFLKRINSSLHKKPLTRTIYLRDLFIQIFLKNRESVEELHGAVFEEYSNVIDGLLKLEAPPRVNEGEKSENQHKKDDFTSKIIDNLEERLLDVVQKFQEYESNYENRIGKMLEAFSAELIQSSRTAGTFQYRQKRYDIDSVDQHLSGNHFQKQQEEWDNYIRSQISDLNINIEIAVYGLNALEAKNTIKAKLHDFFRDAFYLPLGEAERVIKKVRENISVIKESEKYHASLEKIRGKLSEDLHGNIFESMKESELLLQPVLDIQKIIGDLQLEARHFSEVIDLAEKREKNQPFPLVVIKSIHWQAQAARFMKEEVIRKLNPESEELRQLVNHGITILDEAIQIVDVNLQAAIDSFSKADSDESDSDMDQSPKEISMDGLSRAINVLGTGIKEVREKQNSYESKVDTLIPDALETLSGNMLRKDFQHLMMQDKALFMREQALDWKDKVSAKSAVLFEKFEIGYRFTKRKFIKYGRIIKPYLGLSIDEVITIREKRSLAEYLASSSTGITIPFIYDRLFNLDFPIDHRFYIPPGNAHQMIAGSFDEWKRGLSSNVIVVGEKGSGKSTLIQFAQTQQLHEEKPNIIVFDKTIIHESQLLEKLCSALDIKPLETKEELILAIKEKKSRSILIVENLQNLFIRNMHGLEALEAFWVIMTSTMDHLFWIVTCSRYAWEFYMKIAESDQYFSHMVQTDQLNESEIEHAILARHKSSGFELYFEPDESFRKSRAYRKLLGDHEESQELLKKNFFNKLYKVSEGNISIAILFWLKSIKESDDHKFTFRPIQVMEIDKLELPSIEVLFMLATIVQHDVLTSEQISMALDMESSNSDLMLARLKTKGIIKETEHGFKLNHLVYRQVVRLLKQRNIIH